MRPKLSLSWFCSCDKVELTTLSFNMTDPGKGDFGNLLKFRNPYTMIVSGQTGSGKTHFVQQLIKNQAQMHEIPFQRIIYVYSVDQPSYQAMLVDTPSVELYNGLPDDLGLNGHPTLLVLDDMMLELQNDKRLAEMFTKMRHKNLSTIFLVQNLYFRSAYATTVTRNAQYIVLFPNLRDSSMIANLGKQIFPRKPSFLIAAFEDAVNSDDYGYLLLDLKAETSAKLRIRTKVFPGETTTVYLPKN